MQKIGSGGNEELGEDKNRCVRRLPVFADGAPGDFISARVTGYSEYACLICNPMNEVELQD
jgi:hypothetical protein